MIPRIIDLENGVPKVTAEGWVIPQIKAILDKYDMQADPYIAYVHFMTWPTSSYINLDEEEKREQVIYDVSNTFGDFDIDDELLEPAIEELINRYYTPMGLLGQELDQELHRLRKYLRNTPVDSDNVKDRAGILKDIEKIAGSYTKVKEQADKEMQTRMKGKAELGDY